MGTDLSSRLGEFYLLNSTVSRFGWNGLSSHDSSAPGVGCVTRRTYSVLLASFPLPRCVSQIIDRSLPTDSGHTRAEPHVSLLLSSRRSARA